MAKYLATFQYCKVVHPTFDIHDQPPILEFSKNPVTSILLYNFKAKDDKDAKKLAEDYSLKIQEKHKTYMPKEHRNLVDKPTLENLVEIIPPRVVKLD